MQFNNSVTRSVAEAARKIMAGETEQKPQELNEELKGDQHKLDKNKNQKLDAEDFKLLRGEKKMKEETELTESHFKVGDKVKCKSSGMEGEVVKLDKEHGEDDEKYYTVKREDGKEMKFAPNELSLMKEENELEEGTKMQVAQGRTRNVGTYGRAKGSEYGGTDWDKEETGKETKPAKRKYGSRQNFVRSTRVNESFTGLLELYNEGGIKSLLQTLSSKIEEEVDNETFTAELEDQKSSMAGKKKQPAVAKASVQAVKVEEEVEIEEGMQQTLRKYVPGYAKKQIDQKMDDGKFGKTDADKDANFYRYKKVQDKLKKEEVAVINADIANGVKMINIEERTLTEPEMKKKEDVVKGMKKNLSSFKDRYGDRAKEVMYATATKISKED